MKKNILMILAPFVLGALMLNGCATESKKQNFHPTEISSPLTRHISLEEVMRKLNLENPHDIRTINGIYTCYKGEEILKKIAGIHIGDIKVERKYYPSSEYITRGEYNHDENPEALERAIKIVGNHNGIIRLDEAEEVYQRVLKFYSAIDKK